MAQISTLSTRGTSKPTPCLSAMILTRRIAPSANDGPPISLVGSSKRQRVDQSKKSPSIVRMCFLYFLIVSSNLKLFSGQHTLHTNLNHLHQRSPTPKGTNVVSLSLSPSLSLSLSLLYPDPTPSDADVMPSLRRAGGGGLGFSLHPRRGNAPESDARPARRCSARPRVRRPRGAGRARRTMTP